MSEYSTQAQKCTVTYLYTLNYLLTKGRLFRHRYWQIFNYIWRICRNFYIDFFSFSFIEICLSLPLRLWQNTGTFSGILQIKIYSLRKNLFCLLATRECCNFIFSHRTQFFMLSFWYLVIICLYCKIFIVTTSFLS